MSGNVLLVLIFITIYAKSCYTIPHINQDSYITTTGRVLRRIYNKFSDIDQNEETKLPLVLMYDSKSRRFRILEEHGEGRAYKKSNKNGFFGEMYKMVQDTFFDINGWPSDRKPTKKRKVKKVPSKSDDDDDPIANFLDNLDLMFYGSSTEQYPTPTPYIDHQPSHKEMLIRTKKSNTKITADTKTSTITTTPMPKIKRIKTTRTTKEPEVVKPMYQDIYKYSPQYYYPYYQPTISYSDFLATTKPKISPKTTESPAHEEEKNLFSSKKNPCDIKKQQVAEEPAASPQMWPQFAFPFGTFTIPTNAPLTTTTTRNNIFPSILVPSMPNFFFPFGALNVQTTTVPSTTTKKITKSPVSRTSSTTSATSTTSVISTTTSRTPTTRKKIVRYHTRATTTSTTTQAPAGGWFSYFNDDQDEPEPEETTDAPSSSWFNIFSDDSDSGLSGVSQYIPFIIPTTPTTTIPPSTAAPTDWFNTFLSSEEDDSAYTYNNNKTKPKKGHRKSYTGFQLLRIYPETVGKVKLLRDLQEETQNSGLMWWSSPTLNRPTDLLVPPDLNSDIVDYLKGENLKHNILIWDVQNAINYENPKLSKMQRLELEKNRGHPLTWRRYHRYADILRFLEYISLKYPDIVELIPLGRSFEGLPIVVAKVSIPKNDSEPVNVNRKKWKLKSKLKPAIWIDGGAHARDWIAPAVATWILHSLVEGEHGAGPDMELIQAADWYILPVVNPDGYEYTHTKDRLWRKTRSKHTTDDDYFTSWFPWTWGTKCYGVDLNRNWDFHWGEKGASTNPCSDYYNGPRAFSEPETKIVSDFLMQNDQIKVYLSLYAYNQMWMLPASYSRDPIVDKSELMEMGKLASSAVKEVSGTSYEVVQSNDIMQAESGTSHDWAKGKAGIKYSYAIKLRDSTGPFGYLLPGSQIIPTARETLEGIKVIVDNM